MRLELALTVPPNNRFTTLPLKCVVQTMLRMLLKAETIRLATGQPAKRFQFYKVFVNLSNAGKRQLWPNAFETQENRSAEAPAKIARHTFVVVWHQLQGIWFGPWELPGTETTPEVQIESIFDRRRLYERSQNPAHMIQLTSVPDVVDRGVSRHVFCTAQQRGRAFRFCRQGAVNG